MNKTDELAIYIHWPFCISKCPYCNFASIAQKKDAIYEDVERYLLLDLKNSISRINKKHIKSVFFGGGTPSLMNPKAIYKILMFLSEKYTFSEDAEISLEANPVTFDADKIKHFHDSGINRISLGIQSFSDKNLKFLGRIYSSKEAYKAAEIISNNFTNFNFDFIFGYESQTIRDLENDLLKAIDFGCTHVSCYQLTFEENTIFYQKRLSGQVKEFSEVKFAKYYAAAESILESNHMYRYEISNYAQKGLESKHNLSYWKYDDYLGVGPSAHSRITMGSQKYEIAKISNPYDWIRALKKDSAYHLVPLTEYEKLEEIFIMGLRLMAGLDFGEIYKQVSSDMVGKYITVAKLQFLRDHELMEHNDAKIKLTKEGFMKVNAIVEFLLR
jgi:oxygen-independent coproporphyrinogen-3 oxidase